MTKKKKKKLFAVGCRIRLVHFTRLLCTIWRCGLGVDTWLRDQEVMGSSSGCARSMLRPLGSFSPYSYVNRVPDYGQYPRVARHL